MARPSKLSPAKIARLRALRDPAREGGPLSLRRAAAELGVSHETARAWDAKHAAKPEGRPSRSKAAAAVAAELVAAPLPAAGDVGALEQVKARADMVSRLLKKLAPAVEREEYSATNFVTLAKYGDDLARLLAELAPPTPTDPNETPAVVEAERTLLARLDLLIAKAEAAE